MAVYKRTYKAYNGPLTPAWSRFTVLSRYGLSTLFTSRPFTAYTVLCFVPFLVGLAFVYLVNSSTARAILNLGSNHPVVNNKVSFAFLVVEGWMGFLLAAWGGPGMITKDFANHSVQLYLSRPLSRAEYLFGKASVLGILLSCTTWIPALILFFVQAQMAWHGWVWKNLWMAGAIVLSCLIGIAIVSLLSMALAVWVKWRIVATILMGDRESKRLNFRSSNLLHALFFFNDTATTEIYTLSLHDALPILSQLPQFRCFRWHWRSGLNGASWPRSSW